MTLCNPISNKINDNIIVKALKRLKQTAIRSKESSRVRKLYKIHLFKITLSRTNVERSPSPIIRIEYFISEGTPSGKASTNGAPLFLRHVLKFPFSQSTRTQPRFVKSQTRNKNSLVWQKNQNLFLWQEKPEPKKTEELHDSKGITKVKLKEDGEGKLKEKRISEKQQQNDEPRSRVQRDSIQDQKHEDCERLRWMS